MTNKTTERLNILGFLGLRFNGSEYFLDDINVHFVEISCDTDEQFNNKVNKIKSVLSERRLIYYEPNEIVKAFDEITNEFVGTGKLEQYYGNNKGWVVNEIDRLNYQFKIEKL